MGLKIYTQEESSQVNWDKLRGSKIKCFADELEKIPLHGIAELDTATRGFKSSVSVMLNLVKRKSGMDFSYRKMENGNYLIRRMK